jgi:hypothetical protein
VELNIYIKIPLHAFCYFHESPVKGARQFFSLGAGFKYNVVKVDVSYLFSASKVKNPLENTLRFR